MRSNGKFHVTFYHGLSESIKLTGQLAHVQQLQ